jgi:hypothetical protein
MFFRNRDLCVVKSGWVCIVVELVGQLTSILSLIYTVIQRAINVDGRRSHAGRP